MGMELMWCGVVWCGVVWCGVLMDVPAAKLSAAAE